jgi:Domain of unknown function (DUF4417)
MTPFILGPTSRTDVGASIGLGCQGCEFLGPCGGVFSDFDCYADCCGKPRTCSVGCPRSDSFVRVMQDAGGLDIDRLWGISHGPDELPQYVPLIHNGSSRSRLLQYPYVALPTYDVVPPGSMKIPSDPADLRKRFCVAPDARVLLISVGKDNRLERFWRYLESRQLARDLAALGVAYITAPNFSFPLDVPRPEHLVNRARSLRAAEHLCAAGLNVVPHINSFNEQDWNCWRDFLKHHPHISLVAQEFQTGLANPTKANWHVWQMCNVEQALGRGLHLIAVGGRRHLPVLVGLSAITVVDSIPFIRACKRRQLEHAGGRWVVKRTPQGAQIDELLAQNVANYASGVENAIAEQRRLGPRIPSAADNHESRSNERTNSVNQFEKSQRRFWQDDARGTPNSSEALWHPLKGEGDDGTKNQKPLAALRASA